MEELPVIITFDSTIAIEDREEARKHALLAVNCLRDLREHGAPVDIREIHISEDDSWACQQ